MQEAPVPLDRFSRKRDGEMVGFDMTHMLAA